MSSRRSAPSREAGDRTRARTVEPARRPAEPPDLSPAERPVLGDIPWGYGTNRVTAMPVDPYRLYVYWELTDEALDAAHAQLADADAGCHLRLYDTTYRVFDGTNANWFTDVAVYRPANNHYVDLGRPGETFHVDVGLRSGDGRFATIARSGAVEMPRDAMSSDGRVDWMTVTPANGTPPAYVHRVSPRAAGPPPRAFVPEDAEMERLTRSLVGEGWARAEWGDVEMGGGRSVRWMRWAGPRHPVRWQVTHGGGVRVEVLFEGERRVIRTMEGVRVVFGPWRVIVHSVEAGGVRRVLDRWMVHYSWLTEEGMARIQTPPIVERIVRSARFAETSGSEARLGVESAASETFAIGASEWRWLGGSELWAQGASEVLQRGASETAYLGASEVGWLGASELGRARASESLVPGASEALLGGASEGLAGGASERLTRGGASDERLEKREDRP